MKRLLLIAFLWVSLVSFSQTKRTITNVVAGTLPTLISEEEKYNIEELTITGELNGTDFRLLRDMAGNNYLGKKTNGRLRELDISGIRFALGGDFFLESQSVSFVDNASISSSGMIQATVNSSEEVPNYLFAGCLLQSVKLPENVVAIGRDAFAGCELLSSITIPNSVRYIGVHAFLRCYNLPSLLIPKAVETIASSAFDNCSYLQSIVVEEGNSVYDSRDNCNAVIETATNQLVVGGISTVIPSSVTSIMPAAFVGRKGLTSITIPKGLTMIGKRAFEGCTSLASIVVESGNPIYDSRDNCNAIIESATNSLFYGCKATTIPKSVTTIGEDAFNGCKELTTLEIPNSITTICSRAFWNCQGLVSLTIPGSVKVIGSHVFIGDNNLKSVKLTEGLAEIGESVFEGCISLSMITIPSSVTSLGKNFIRNCSGLKVVVSHISDPYAIDDDIFSNSQATLYVPSGTLSKYQSLSGWNKFTSIQEGDVKEVKVGNLNYLCYTVSQKATVISGDYSQLSEVEVPATVDVEGAIFDVNEIGYRAFCQTGIKKVLLSSSLTSIGERAFYGCKNLTDIEISEGVENIDAYAFYNCGELRSVGMGFGLKSIGKMAFAYCWSLTDVYCRAEEVPNTDASAFTSSISEKTSLHVPEIAVQKYKVTTPWSSFNKILAIREISSIKLDGLVYNLSTDGYIAEVVQSSDGYSGEIIIPNKVTYEEYEFTVKSIGDKAFSGCSNLKTVTIPSSITSIGNMAFSGCSELVTIDCKAGNVPSTAVNAFDGVQVESVVVNVPFNRVAIYKTAEPWCQFSNIIEKYKPIEIPLTFEAVDGTVTVSIMNYYCSFMPTIQYSIDGGPWTDFTLSNNDCHGSSRFSNQLPAGKVVSIRSNEWHGGYWDDGDRFDIDCDADCYVYGNVMSLCKGENYATDYENSGDLAGLFKYNTHIRNHPTKNLVLPSTTLSRVCYARMFAGCTGLTRAPELPATTLAEYCYAGMFEGCTGLTKAPELPATKLEKGCYISMFLGCKNLKYIKCLANENIIKGNDEAIDEVIGKGLPLWILGEDDNSTVTSWLKDAGTNVIGTKTFVVNESLTVTGDDPLTATVENWGERSVSGIPEGWALGNLKGETEPIMVSSAKQVTYMSDKDLDFTGYPDLKAYVATGYDKNSGTIWLTRVKEVPANTGFLLMGEADTYEIPVKAGGLSSYYQNMFKGTLEATTIYTTDGDYTNYYLSNGESGVGFYKVTKEEGVTLAANRAYLPIPTEIPVVGTAGSTETIKVSSAGQVPYYNTESLDFSSLDAQGVKAYTATGYDYNSGTIWLTRVKQVPAKTGILIMAPEGEYPVPTASISSVYANMFRGTLEGTTIQTHEEIDGKDYINYYLSSGASGVGFYRVTKEEGVTIGTNRCYLPILNKDAAAGTRSANSDQNQIAFEEADEVIGIPLFRGIGGDENGTTSIKEVKSGEVKSDEWFTLQGQRVAKPGKGLYIKNGKKVIIK